MRMLPAIAILLAALSLRAQTAAISADPPPDTRFPAATHELAVPSHGSQLLGVFYTAPGNQPHPTVILFHGFPGYEQNLDLAQALRRAGYHVLAMHYRGTWGVKGDFSFTHAMEDADAQVDWLITPAVAAQYRVDPSRIIVIGHSMGGYMAASAAAHHPAIRALVMISAWNISRPYFGMEPTEEARAGEIFRRGTEPADYLPLSGTSEARLITEVFAHRNTWDFVRMTPALGKRPVLMITADDDTGPDSAALLKALQSAGNRASRHLEMKTDHAFSDHRIALETTILDWLNRLPS